MTATPSPATPSREEAFKRFWESITHASANCEELTEATPTSSEQLAS